MFRFSGARRRGIDIYSLLAPNNIFQKRIQELSTRAGAGNSPGESHTALKLANMFHYGDSTYDYTGNGAGPNFYGAPYAGGKVPHSRPAGITHTSGTITVGAPTIYKVAWNHPTQKVQLYVKGTSEPFAPSAHNGLQEKMEAVPLPELSQILAVPQNLTCGGTDKPIVILRFNLDGTIEMWEIFQLQFDSVKKEWYGHWGGYIANTRVWNGVFPNNWGIRAPSIASFGGVITLQDLVKVARGGSIDHALGITVPATGPTHVSPATRQDFKPEPGINNMIVAEHEGNPNPAFEWEPPPAWVSGTSYTPGQLVYNAQTQYENIVSTSGTTAPGSDKTHWRETGKGAPFDVQQESSYFRLPASLDPHAYLGSSPGMLELAIFRAMQGNPGGSEVGGLIIFDAGPGAVKYCVECPLTIGTKYCTAAVDPLVGSPIRDERGSVGSGGQNEIYNWAPASWAPRPALPGFNEHLVISTVYKNTKTVFTNQPVHLLEVVDPAAFP